MRANHAVTLGLCVGLTGLATLPLAAAGCGTDTFGTCSDNNTCGGGGDAGADGETDSSSLVDSSMTGDTGDSGTADSTSGDSGPAGDSSVGETGTGCEAGTVDCNGVCVNESNDPSHCGSCSKVCPGPDAGMGIAICSSSTCALGCESDAGTSLLCGSQCVNPVNINHCGTCSNVCPPPTANGTANCVAGSTGPSCTFACTNGYHPCGATCLSNTDDPSSDPCVVADGLGIFVSPTGSDSGSGTKEAPFATIGHGMAAAAGGTKRVYACGTFSSAVSVVAADDGVTVYGGFDCASWAYSAATPTHVTPTAAGFALQVVGTTTGVFFEDFTFAAQSAPATPPTNTSVASSIAVFVSGAKATFTRVNVAAGSGQPGGGGTSNSNWSGTPSTGSTPTSLVTGGGGGAQNLCVDKNWSEGGAGSNVPGVASNGSALPTVGSPNGGLSGGAGCTPGGVGANGPAPSPAASGGSTSGSVGASGWTAGAGGAAGANGSPSQGGGGGGSNADATGGAGGGGGSGGCGGGDGSGGETGGSSIGVLSFQATVVLSNVTISTQAAGAGGAGGAAQAGQVGATGGAGGGSGNCQAGSGGGAGGTGGTGGGGGGGGGGAGGLSAGIAWHGGTAPAVNGASVTSQVSGVPGVSVGAAGTAGGGGAGGPAPSANAGPPGQPGAVGQAADVINL